MNNKLKATVLACILVVTMTITMNSSQASILGKIIKVGGVGYVVDKFGPQINDFVNKVLANNKLETTEATAVVPILTVGSGGYIGAVQVIGEESKVNATKAVLQIEANTVFGSSVRIKALVPVNVRSITNVKRIYGVGVSAIIDIGF